MSLLLNGSWEFIWSVGLVTTLLNSCGYKLKQKQKQKESNISNEYSLRIEQCSPWHWLDTAFKASSMPGRFIKEIS